MDHNHHHNNAELQQNDMSTMKMYFHFGFGDQILFEQLKVDSTLKLWSVCGLLFLITILFEYIKYVRSVRCGCQVLKVHGTGNSENNYQDNETNLASLPRNCFVGGFHNKKHRMIQTALHTVQTSIGFLLMLAVMSFNLCIIFAIIAGKWFIKFIQKPEIYERSPFVKSCRSYANFHELDDIRRNIHLLTFS